MIKQIILTGALLAIAAVPAQAKLQGERVFTTEDGKWEVIRDVDSFTDEVSCTVAYVEDNGIQAAGDELYVTVKGGIRGYQMRQDDKPAGGMRIATDIEKRIDALVISEPWFEKIFEGDRLRIQVITWTNGLVNIDLNTANLQGAYETIPSCESGTI